MAIIYFDNAATSWPKPEGVSSAWKDCFPDAAGNPGRSGHRMSVGAARVVEDARSILAQLFNVRDPSHLVFTQNATQALNTGIYGLLRPGDHAVTTSMEHNSVMRPLRHLETLGVELTVVPCAKSGTIDLDQVRQAMRPGTRLLVTTHGSNVAGTLMPIDSLTELAREHNALCLVDASQTAGAIAIDVQELGVDLLAFTGHKSLLGPTGTGGLYIREGVTLAPLMRGGTGSESAYEVQPDFLPDAHESGTQNVAGLAGLGVATQFLLNTGIDVVRKHEQKLVSRFVSGASDIPGITIYGPRDPVRQCGLVSFNITGTVPSEVSQILDESYGIMARPGLHCAPSAHRTLGTFPTGTVRFSFGWFNTPAEIDASVEALRQIAQWAAKSVKTWMA